MSVNTHLVPGENFIFYSYDGGIWKPYMCARSGSITVVTEEAETSVTGSGDWATFEMTKHSFTLQLDGVISLNNSGGLSLPDLRAKQFAKEKMLCRFLETSIGADTYLEQFYAFINNSVATGSFDGIATFSISLKGTGAITQIFTPPSPTTGKMYRYPAMGSTAPVAAGVSTVIVTGLGNKDMQSIVKDGRGGNDIILSGTPVNTEVLYETVNGTDGQFTWAFPFEENETWYCNYQNL